MHSTVHVNSTIFFGPANEEPAPHSKRLSMPTCTCTEICTNILLFIQKVHSNFHQISVLNGPSRTAIAYQGRLQTRRSFFPWTPDLS